MIVALHDDERVARGRLRRDEPWKRAAVARPAHTEPLPLPERVVRKAMMLADDFTAERFDRTRRSRQVSPEEVAEWTLADEADARRVLLRPRRNAFAPSDGAHVPLRELAQRKKDRRELLLR